MKLSKLIKKSAIRLNMRSTDKSEALSELVDLLCTAHKLKERNTILEAIIQREEKQSTGVGMGLALPHAKTPVVKRLHVAFACHRDGIDFDSTDGEKAYLFFILVSPRDVSGPHIEALANISRLVKHEELRTALLECRNEKELISRIEEAEKKYL